MTVEQCWAVSEHWYAGRLDLGYARPAPTHFQALLRGVGLAGEAWSLTGAPPSPPEQP